MYSHLTPPGDPVNPGTGLLGAVEVIGRCVRNVSLSAWNHRLPQRSLLHRRRRAISVAVQTTMRRGGTLPPHLGKMRESLTTRHVALGMGAIAMEAAEVIELLRTLRTVRQFTDQPVPQAVLDDLLTVARWSGSANNRQPWVFIVVRDRDTLQRLSELEGYVRHLAGAALAIVVVMDGAADQVEQETFDEGVLSQ